MIETVSIRARIAVFENNAMIANAKSEYLSDQNFCCDVVTICPRGSKSIHSYSCFFERVPSQRIRHSSSSLNIVDPTLLRFVDLFRVLVVKDFLFACNMEPTSLRLCSINLV